MYRARGARERAALAALRPQRVAQVRARVWVPLERRQSLSPTPEARALTPRRSRREAKVERLVGRTEPQ